MFEVEIDRVFSPEFRPLTPERQPSSYQPYDGRVGMRWESSALPYGFSEAILLDEHSRFAVENWGGAAVGGGANGAATHVMRSVHHLGRYVFIQMRLAGESTEAYQSGMTILRRPLECSISTVQTSETLQKTERMINGHLTLTLMFRPEGLREWLTKNADCNHPAVREVLLPESEEMVHRRFGMGMDMIHLVRSVISNSLHGNLRHQFMKQSAMSMLYLMLNRLMTLDTPSQPNSMCRREERRIAERAASILNSNLGEAPSIAELSRELATNKNKLLQSFKDTYGKTIQQYVLDLRMNTAYDMIVGESLPLSKIAHFVGYDYVNNFSTRFTEYFGISPTQLRHDDHRPPKTD